MDPAGGGRYATPRSAFAGALREWYLAGGDGLLAGISANLITRTEDRRGEAFTDFDHTLNAGAFKAQFTTLPTTYGRAMNQNCEVCRFGGPAQVALAITGNTAPGGRHGSS